MNVEDFGRLIEDVARRDELHDLLRNADGGTLAYAAVLAQQTGTAHEFAAAVKAATTHTTEAERNG